MSPACAPAPGGRCASIRGRNSLSPGTHRQRSNFDAIIIGYYDDGKLVYAARTGPLFTQYSRVELFKKLKPLEIKECPFANLPEAKSGRWGAGLTAAKMKDCRWLKPVLVGQFEFVEWTDGNHLRHTHFVALREDKKARRRPLERRLDNKLRSSSMRPIPGTQCGVLKESGMEIPPEALHLIKSGLNKLEVTSSLSKWLIRIPFFACFFTAF